VSEFVTLDGVMEAPGHEEHRHGKNAWALRAATEGQTNSRCVANLTVRVTTTTKFKAISPEQDVDHLAGVSKPVKVRVFPG